MAGLTPAPLDIEAKAALSIAANLCLVRLGKEFPDVIEDSCIGCRVTSGRPADWRLINVNHLFYVFNSAN